MEVLVYIFHWGTPLGLGLFFMFSGIGAGMFFWGISRLNEAVEKNKKKKS